MSDTTSLKVICMQVPPFSLKKQLSELGPDLEAAVSKVLRSGQFIGGKEVEAFEEAFADLIEVPFAVGCNSGTDALVLALRALDIGPGDEVITSSFSFFATAEAISSVGAVPVFVDVQPETFLIDLDAVHKSINPATKAILPVHLFGCPTAMDELMILADQYGLKVIEDCAQATGASWKGRPLGGWGDIGCFSFFPTKNLGAAGDGGAITTKDSNLAERIRQLAIHGMPRRYLHTQLGYNSRLDAIQASILNIKLPKLPGWVKQRQVIASKYQKLLHDLPGLELPFLPTDGHMIHAWNQFVVKVKASPMEEESNSDDSTESCNYVDRFCRDWLKKSLHDLGINTIIYYPIPIHLQPAYRHLNYKVGSLPITERICNEVLSLPIFPEITIQEQEYVCNSLRELCT